MQSLYNNPYPAAPMHYGIDYDLPYHSNREGDLYPREYYRLSCQGCPQWAGLQNNPCRKDQLPLAQAGYHPVCDYASKRYYHQHHDMKSLHHLVNDAVRKAGKYN